MCMFSALIRRPWNACAFLSLQSRHKRSWKGERLTHSNHRQNLLKQHKIRLMTLLFFRRRASASPLLQQPEACMQRSMSILTWNTIKTCYKNEHSSSSRIICVSALKYPLEVNPTDNDLRN